MAVREQEISDETYYKLSQVFVKDIIEVWCPNHRRFNDCVVKSHLPNGRFRFRVSYNDGDEEDIDLVDKIWHFIGKAAVRYHANIVELKNLRDQLSGTAGPSSHRPPPRSQPVTKKQRTAPIVPVTKPESSSVSSEITLKGRGSQSSRRAPEKPPSTRPQFKRKHAKKSLAPRRGKGDA